MKDRFTRLEFLYQHSYANVQFADQKAMFLAPINVAAIGAAVFLAGKAGNAQYFACLAAFFIGAGLLACGLVVWPRSPIAFWRISSRSYEQDIGIVDPNRIARHGSAEAFRKSFDALQGNGEASSGNDETDLAGEFTAQYYELIFKHCSIHLTKYKYLRIALLLSGVGWLVLAGAAGYSLYS